MSCLFFYSRGDMRIFYSFLIIVCSSILILLPVTAGVYDYRTDIRTDNFAVSTAVGADNTTVQLFKDIFDDDASTVEISSDEVSDAPYWVSYNGTSRALLVAGLTANTTRTLDISYDTDAIGEGGITNFLGILPWVWIIIWVAFPIGGLVAIWTGRAG